MGARFLETPGNFQSTQFVLLIERRQSDVMQAVFHGNQKQGVLPMQRWSFPLMVILSLCCLFVSNLQSAVEAEKPLSESDSDIKEMLTRIEQLEQRVRELEQKPALVPVPGTTLTSPPRLLLTPPGAAKVIPALPQQPTHPQNWKRNQINGIDYYIVPLSQSDRTPVR